jgi:hypothetical protein
MNRRLVLLVVLLGMLGCAHEYHWTKVNVTQQEWDQSYL